MSLRRTLLKPRLGDQKPKSGEREEIETFAEMLDETKLP